MSRWLIAVIVVIVVVFFGYRYLGAPDEVARQAQDAAQQAAGAAQQAAQQAGQAAQQAAGAAQQAAESAASTAQQAASEAAAGAAAMADSLRSLTLNGTEIGAQIGGAVDSIRTSLSGITDGATAQAAKAKLEEAGRSLDGVSAQVEQLPAEGRKLLASTISAALPTLKAGSEKVAGLSPDLKPTLDAIIAKLEGWANAPA
ncbi:MAG TPA: hypothetical protein PKA13_09355 [Geminicoccaceae bacterium]|nr:hypothetical protein [Geminicoccus sp.]HMU49972.1 hypothetical protein [Geminicoccaceae bacterium]